MSANVVVYTTDYCPYCTRAKALLTKKGAPFREVRVDERPDIRSWLGDVTKQRTVPQVFVGETHVGGCDDLYALEQQGKLDAMLAV